MSSSISRRGLLGLGGTLYAGFGLGRNASAEHAAPGAASNPGRCFNVLDFGAKGDGKTLNTRALQAAIDACHHARGGIVLVPAGNFLTGTVQLKSWVTLQLEAGATLLGSGNGRDYHAAREIPLHGDATLRDGHVGLIYAVNAENIAVEGPGTIDGQGELFHGGPHHQPPPSGRGGRFRPFQMLFYRCTRLRVRDLWLRRGAFHAIRVIESQNAWFDNLHIHNRVNGNNDGFHFISCEYVHVNGCDILSGDDACALFGSCRNVTVANSSFSTRWSVFRFGGGTAENIAISNCILHEVYGCPVKMQCNPGSRFENISFANLLMENVTGPIQIGNGPRAHNRRGQPPRPPASAEVAAPGMVRNISFSHIRARVVHPQRMPGLLPFHEHYNPGEIYACIALDGMANSWLDGISFDDVQIIFPGGGTAAEGKRAVPEFSGEYFQNGILPAWALYARNVRGLSLANVRFELAAADARPALHFHSVEDAALNGLTLAGEARATAALHFNAVKDCLLSGPRLLSHAKVFLAAAGDCRNIQVDGGDLSRAARALELAPGMAAGAVGIRR